MTQYVGIRSEGGLIPYDVLDKIATEESGFGQQPKDFGLPAGRRLTDEIARAWSDAQDYWHIFQRRTASLPESETGTTLTRKWISDLLNEQLLGYELTYQPSGAVTRRFLACLLLIRLCCGNKRVSWYSARKSSFSATC